ARRAWPAWLDGQPQAGGAPDAHPRHRRLPAPPAPQPDPPRPCRAARTGSAGPAVRPRAARRGLVRRCDLDPHRRGWLYLASVIDLASRHLLGYSMAAHHDASLVTGALEAAVATRGRQPMADTIFHSDRGSWEYTSTACIDACQRLGLRRSMSRT